MIKILQYRISFNNHKYEQITPLNKSQGGILYYFHALLVGARILKIYIYLNACMCKQHFMARRFSKYLSLFNVTN